MALVVFLRGVNVGGHKTFRPSTLAKELAALEVVNIGAAGTFIVRKPISQAKLRAELACRLPFETDVMICEGRELIKLAEADPFADEPSRPDVVRFISILSKTHRSPPALPIVLPADGPWLLRIVGLQDRYVLGLYRRHMKAIGYLGQIDKIVGVRATTRNWNTLTAIIKILNRRRGD